MKTKVDSHSGRCSRNSFQRSGDKTRVELHQNTALLEQQTHAEGSRV